MNAQSVFPALLQVVQGSPVILPSHLTLLSLQFLHAIIDLFRFALAAVAAAELLRAVSLGPTICTTRLDDADADEASSTDEHGPKCPTGDDVLSADDDLPLSSSALRLSRRRCR